MRVFLFPMLLALSSCGSLQKWAMRSATPLFQESSNKLTQEANWDFFRESTPGNLKFLELLYLSDPKNEGLLGVLVKGHTGFAFAVPETLALGDELGGVESSPWKERAIYHYTRALDYGLDYLNRRGVTHQDLLDLDEAALSTKLKEELSKKDVVAVIYLGQAWGSLINLQKDNVSLVAKVPKVKVLFDWACGVEPDIDDGVCDIFYAQYEASRPRMLGGNPAKAKELYEKASQKYPHNLLIRLGQIQYLVLPAMDEEEYDQLATPLKAELAKWEDLNRDALENKSEYRGHADVNLYNAIAKKRLELIEKNRKNIF